jgi:3-hydroxyacyl-[acyl-carrier-protein] dehydratase
MPDECAVTIRSDHPALPGHFPGHPIVPGVVLLGEVMDCLRRLLGAPVVITGLPAAKFHRPLKPGEAVTIRFERERPGCALFECRVGAALIASGEVEFESGGS